MRQQESKRSGKVLAVLLAGALVVSAGIAHSGNLIEGEVESPSNPSRWQDYLDLLKNDQVLSNYKIVQESPDLIPEYLFTTLAHAFTLVSTADPNNPEFIPYLNQVFNLGIPNPDTAYYYAHVDGRNTYRIIGTRGSVHFIEFQTGRGYHGIDDKWAVTLNEKTIDDFQVNEDGTFEIFLSAERPADFQGNWMELDDNAKFVLIRQVAYGPGEENGRLAIVKENGNVPEPSTDAQLKLMADLVIGKAKLWLGAVEVLAEKNIYNRLVPAGWDSNTVVIDQLYQHGLYDVTRDEALIVTVKAPDSCKYWSIQSANLLGQTYDYIHSQSNLNGHVDRADKDGLTRFVLSHRDPGVANWIDLRRPQKGYILMRWLKCNSIPEPAVKKVALPEIDRYLPEETKRVMPDQRARALREMSIDKQLRRNW